MDVGGSQELGGFEKEHLFGSMTLIGLLDRVPLHRRPVYVFTTQLFTTGPVSAQSSSLPRTSRLCGRNGTCRPCDCGILLENGKLPSSSWLTLQGRRNNRVSSRCRCIAASHFRYQGSLTVGWLRYPFSRLLAGS